MEGAENRGYWIEMRAPFDFIFEIFRTEWQSPGSRILPYVQCDENKREWRCPPARCASHLDELRTSTLREEKSRGKSKVLCKLTRPLYGTIPFPALFLLFSETQECDRKGAKSYIWYVTLSSFFFFFLSFFPLFLFLFFSFLSQGENNFEMGKEESRKWKHACERRTSLFIGIYVVHSKMTHPNVFIASIVPFSSIDRLFSSVQIFR